MNSCIDGVPWDCLIPIGEISMGRLLDSRVLYVRGSAEIKVTDRACLVSMYSWWFSCWQGDMDHRSASSLKAGAELLFLSSITSHVICPWWCAENEWLATVPYFVIAYLDDDAWTRNHWQLTVVQSSPRTDIPMVAASIFSSCACCQSLLYVRAPCPSSSSLSRALSLLQLLTRAFLVFFQEGQEKAMKVLYTAEYICHSIVESGDWWYTPDLLDYICMADQ